MKQHSKFLPAHQQTEQQTAAHQSQQEAGQEFASAEELLRYDAAQIAVPPQIAERLKASAGQCPPPPRRSWWQQWLGQ